MTKTVNAPVQARASKQTVREVAIPDAIPCITTTAPTTPKPSKQDQIITMLLRPDGASLDEMVTLTGWLPHTARALLSSLKKKGHKLCSEKTGDTRRYRIVGKEVAA